MDNTESGTLVQSRLPRADRWVGRTESVECGCSNVVADVVAGGCAESVVLEAGAWYGPGDRIGRIMVGRVGSIASCHVTRESASS
jgi:hypothetical protein